MSRLLLFVSLSTLALTACVSLEEPVRIRPTTNVTYRSEDGTTIRSYLARPSAPGPYPAVIMIHEWWGLNQDVASLADALAAEGFVVLAADAHRGELATSVPAAIALNQRTPQDRIAADLDAALDYLRAHEAVDPRRIAVMGFCFGGRQAMHLGIRATGLAGVITLYGSGLVTEPALLGNMAGNGPVLGIFGERDASIPLRDVQRFTEALEAIGAQATVTVYPGVGHAFVNSSTFRDDGPAGRAWNRVVAFLKGTLQ